MNPHLISDDAGVWRFATDGRRFGIAWPEIYRVIGYALDGVTELHFVAELESDAGLVLEFHADWPGFQSVVASISDQLSGLSPQWFATVEAMVPTDPPVVLWHRKASQ